MKISAIETEYKGRLFRSRLEARWAVAFDAAGILWEYEPEAFKLSSGGVYLPDFYLPEFEKGIYAEVKPVGGDFSKAMEFSESFPIWLCEGEPAFRVYIYITPESSCPGPGLCAKFYEPNHVGEWVVPLYDQASGENRFFYQPLEHLDVDSNGCVPEYPECQWGAAVRAARAFRPWNRT